MQKHNDAIKMSGHSSLEKYTSHFIKRVRKGYEGYYCVKGELGTEQNYNILTPTFMAITAFLFRHLGCSTGGLGAQPQLGRCSHSSNFSPTDLNFLSSRLYNNLTSTYFLLFTQVHFFFWQLGQVGGQYATFLVCERWVGDGNKLMQQISTEGVEGETRLGWQGDPLGNMQEI